MKTLTQMYTPFSGALKKAFSTIKRGEKEMRLFKSLRNNFSSLETRKRKNI